MPGVTNLTSPLMVTQKVPSALQPGDLLRDLPTIVNTAPVDMRTPRERAVQDGLCSTSNINTWITDNPMIAALGLAALGFYVFGKGR
jgi:hypothetical protein